jgi:hypothetical protein
MVSAPRNKCFIAIAAHLQLNAEAWPGQETIAQFSGCSTRAVRFHVAVLERGEFLVLRRERRANGVERIFYSPGPVMLRELSAFCERYPKDRPKVLTPVPAAPPVGAFTLSHPPETVSGPLAETPSMEPDQNQIEPSSCELNGVHQGLRQATDEQQMRFGQEDEEVACQALVERMVRKHPKRPAPRWFDAGEIAMVAKCAAALGGGAEAKLLAHRDAIRGAFHVSKIGPPTVRFIWGKFDHFDHVERGRRRRIAEESTTRRRREAEASPTVPTLQRPTIPREQMQADLERLFGPGWKNRLPHRPTKVLASSTATRVPLDLGSSETVRSTCFSGR